MEEAFPPHIKCGLYPIFIGESNRLVRQQNRFLAIMENFNRVQEIQSELMDASGTTAIQYSHYLDSVEASANRLQVALEKMWLDTLSSDTIKVFYDFITALVKIIDKVGLLELAISGLVTIVFLGSDAFKTLRVNVYGATEASTFFGVAANALKTTMKGLTLAIVGVDLAVSALYVALTLGLSYAITKLITYISKFIEKNKELQRQTDFMVDNFDKSKNKIDELIESYKELYDVINRNEEQEEEYIKVREQLAELLPSIKAGIDEEGNARLKHIDIIDEEYKRIKALNDEKRKERTSKYKSSFEANAEEIEKYESKIKSLENSIEHLEKKMESMSGSSYSFLGTKLTIEQYRKEIDELISSIVELKGENFDAYIQQITDLLENMGVSLDNNVKDAMYAMVKNLDILPEHIEVIIEDIAELSKELSELDPKSKEYATRLASGFAALGTKIDSAGMMKSKFTRILLDYIDAVEEAIKANEENIDSIKEFTSSLSDSEKKIKAYQSALKELDDTGQLSISTMISMIETNEELIDLIGDEATLRKELKNLIEEEKDIALKAIGEKLMANEEYYAKLKRENVSYINKLSDDYGVDLSNFKSLAEAKLGVEQHLLSELSKMWANYVGLTVDHAKRMMKAFEADAIKFGIDPTTQTGYDIIEMLVDLENKFKDFSTVGIKVDFDGISKASKSAKEISQYISDDLAKKIDEVNGKLVASNYALSQYDETSVEYRKELEKQIELQEQLQALYHQGANQLRARNEEIKRSLLFQKEWTSLTKEQKEELNKLKKELDDNEKAINSFGNSWWSAQTAISNAQKAIEKSYEAVGNLADEIISTIKKAYQRQRDLELARIDDALDALKREHDTRIAYLDEELSKFQEVINAKKQLIDREEESADFNKQLAKEQEKLAEFLQQRDVYALDDSFEARLKVNELDKSIAEQKEKIEEMQHKRTVDLRKQNLDDQLKSFTKEIDSKKKSEKAQYEVSKYRLEQEKKDIKWHYDELINNETKYANLRKQIIQGNIDEVQNILQKFLDGFKDYNEDVVKSIGYSWQELINLMNEITFAQGNLGSVSGSKPSAKTTSDGGDKARRINEFKGQKHTMNMWGHEYVITEGGHAIYKNGEYVPPENFKYLPAEVTSFARNLKEQLSQIETLHDGGIVGKSRNKFDNMIEKLFNMKPNERLIKALENEIIIKPRGIADNFIPNLQNFANRIQSKAMAVAGNGSSSKSDIININLRIDNFVANNKKQADNLLEIINKEMKKRGK